MKRIGCLLLIIILIFIITGCNKSVENNKQKESVENTNQETNNNEVTNLNIKITVKDKILHATLEDNSTSRALIEKMPFTIKMMNLYGREMCYRYGAGTLPTDNPKDLEYEIGDISFWPPGGSLVILYKQNGEVFEQQHLGHIKEDVSFFDGMEDTDITFELDN